MAESDKEMNIGELKSKFVMNKENQYPASNPYTPEKDYLGKVLFFDPRLSGSNWISCASCHNPGLGYEDGMSKGLGHNMKQLGRKTPTVLNLNWAPHLFWDGRASSLEEQALGPIASPGEMAMDMDKLEDKVMSIKGYKALFDAGFPGQGISKKTISEAIATFERGLVSEKAPFDYWIDGNENAISDDAKKGFVLFNGKASCVQCHSTWKFTDYSFHDVGLASDDIGRGKLVKLQSQQYAFKTPTLRNITSRGPYFHDGSKKTLEEVIEFYNKGGEVKRPSLSGNMQPLKLSSKEVKYLVEFLVTLSSKDKDIVYPQLPR